MVRLHIIYLLVLCSLALFLYSIYVVKTTGELITMYKNTIKVDIGEANTFYNYRIKFNKSYGREEFPMRFRNFMRSLNEITMLNQKEGRRVFGLTKFSDLSQEEFVERFHQNRTLHSSKRTEYMNCVEGFHDMEPVLNKKKCFQNLDERPDKFDWRDQGVVGPVLDQKLCQTCFAFGIVGVMESVAAKNKIYHNRLSIQELIDCSKDNDYSKGCKAGNILRVLTYQCIEKYRDIGLAPEQRYPLTLNEESCRVVPPVVKLKEFLLCMALNEKNLPGLIWKYGPALAVVNSAPWKNYIEGVIYRACDDPGNEMSHVVQIVGYDTSGPNPYYIIRNSWGRDFGEHGYVKLQMGENICGVADEVGFLDVYGAN